MRVAADKEEQLPAAHGEDEETKGEDSRRHLAPAVAPGLFGTGCREMNPSKVVTITR